MSKKKREIKNAYEAYWFLQDHPKLNVMERTPITSEEADAMETQGYIISRDPSGQCYRYWRHMLRHAQDHNLDIFYTMVDPKTRRIEDDKSRNTAVECWLEFGALSYGFAYSGGDTPMGDYDDTTTLHHEHDYRLDGGGSTLDEALIQLAKKVLKRYGDYSDKRVQRRFGCGKPVCADCGDVKRMRKRLDS
jgi:hypothetical protein